MTPTVPTKLQMLVNNALLGTIAGMIALIGWIGNVYVGHVNAKMAQIDVEERAIGILSARVDTMHEAINQLVQTDKDLIAEIKAIRTELFAKKL